MWGFLGFLTAINFSTPAQIHSCRAPSSPRYSDKWYQQSDDGARQQSVTVFCAAVEKLMGPKKPQKPPHSFLGTCTSFWSFPPCWGETPQRGLFVVWDGEMHSGGGGVCWGRYCLIESTISPSCVYRIRTHFCGIKCGLVCP